MTQKETARLLILIKAEYPNAFNSLSKTELSLKKEMWSKVFKNYPYGQVENAFYEYVLTNQSGFPPTAGQINAILTKKLNPGDGIDCYEAWELVVKTLSSSEFHYEPKKTFEQLPQKIQRCIGNYSVMREWAVMEQSRLTYIKNDFIRHYREIDEADNYNNLLADVSNSQKQLPST